MTKTIKKSVSVLLAIIMILSVFTIVPMSAGASTWTFKLNSNFFTPSWSMVDIASGEDVALNLAAGSYQFQIVAYEDGNLSSYRGNGMAGSPTDSYNAGMYSDDSTNAGFTATGGHYVLNYNGSTGNLTITKVSNHTWDTITAVWDESPVLYTSDYTYDDAYKANVTLTCAYCDVTHAFEANTEYSPAAIQETPASCVEDGYFEVHVRNEEFNLSHTYTLPGEEAVGEHWAYTHHPEVPATYNSTGTQEYWECDFCGKLYSDAAMTQEIPEPVVIPMLTGAVAEIDGYKYGTFAEAVADRASNDDVIKLLAAAGSYEMALDQVIKVNKNSKTLTLTAPEGAYAVTYAYDTATKVYTYSVVEAVAKAEKSGTTTYYPSAYDALRNATTGSTITLLKDSTESAVTVGSKLSGKTYIIDLNDKTLTLNGNGNALFNIASPSNLTIKNGSIVFDGTGTNQNGFQLNDVYNTAVLTIEDDVTVEAKGDCSVVTASGGTLHTEGTLISADCPAITTTNVSMGSGYAINVEGGSVTSTNAPAINQVNATGTLTITGGTITGTEDSADCAINVTAGTATISGGTFNSDVSEYTTTATYQNASGEVVVKDANTIYDDYDFTQAAANGGEWYIVADVNGDGVTVTSNLKIWNTHKNHNISGNVTIADGAKLTKAGGKKTYNTGTVTLSGGSLDSGNYTMIVVANDPYVHGQIVNVASGAIIYDGDGNRIVYDAISLTYAAKNGSEVYLVDDIADMYSTMNVNSGTFTLHGNGHTVNFTISGNYASALGKTANIAIDNLDVTVASGKALKSFIQTKSTDDTTSEVSIDGVTAQGFSTDAVYTGGGDWTFANATVTSDTQPECPQDWKAVDNEDGTWTIVAKDYIAQVGDNKYETLNEAVEDAIVSGNVIYLLADCDSTTDHTFNQLDGAALFADPATEEITFTVNGNGFYGAGFAARVDAASGPYRTIWTTTGTTPNIVYNYTITPAAVAVISGTNGAITYPASLYAALYTSAKSGDTVQLLSNIDLDAAKATITVKKNNVTLDLNNYTLTGVREGFLEVKANQTLNVENGTIGGEGSVKLNAGSTLALDGATVSAPVTAGAGANITFDNGADLTGDITVPEDYELVTDEVTGNKSVVYAPKLAPKHSITLRGNIELNFFLNPALVQEGDVVTCTWNGEIENEVTHTVVAADLKPEGYMVSVSLPAAEMTEKVHVTVNNVDGMFDDYSVRDYCDVILDAESDFSVAYAATNGAETYGKLVDLVKSMLDYGAMAQIVFEKNDDDPEDLANNGIELGYDRDNFGTYDIHTAVQYQNGYDCYYNQATPDAVDWYFGANFYTASLSYLSKSTLRLYFTPADPMYGSMPYLDDYDGNKEYYYYYVQEENIAAADLDRRYEFTVGEQTFYYSPLDFVEAILDSTSANVTPAQKDLAKATYWYNHFANIYFAAIA